MRGLDKYLETPPEDDSAWFEEVAEHYSEEFWDKNEEWINESELSIDWHNKLFDHLPEQCAEIIERGFKLYKL